MNPSATYQTEMDLRFMAAAIRLAGVLEARFEAVMSMLAFPARSEVRRDGEVNTKLQGT